MTARRREQALREEHGWGMHDAIKHIRKQHVLKDLAAATSLENPKIIIRRLIASA